MKYVLVTGGVISGIGKGVVTSSLGTIFKSYGYHVTSIKIDPYINIDAGTFSPYEHGEVFVLSDGAEVDLDLGNYERFMDITLHRDNNITTGKIYQHVIEKERRGDYLGKTVQVVPHITEAIQEWVTAVAKKPVTPDNEEPEICIIELGGTIGDIEGMPFVEAFRQFEFRMGRENLCSVHVSLVPRPKTTGEPKTKPTQNSVRELRRLGLNPDVVVCRCEKPFDDGVKEKISNFCHVPTKQVVCVPDCTSIYHVPLILEETGIAKYILEEHFRLSPAVPFDPETNTLWKKWIDLSERCEHLRRTVSIALIGKYVKLEDAYISLTKALRHAALAINHKVDLFYVDSEDLEESTRSSRPVAYHEAWRALCSAQGIIIPGGFGIRGVEGKLLACKYARESNVPLLGICLGMQAIVIEFARNVLGWQDAHSMEANPDTPVPVIIDMPEHNPGMLGGTMRLGSRRTEFKTLHFDSVIRQLYGNVSFVEERHRHRYEVNPAKVAALEKAGLHFVGHDETGNRMEIVELQDHRYYVGVQYHPEYQTRPMKPSPPYLGLILAATKKLQGYLERGVLRLTPPPSTSSKRTPESSDLEEEAAGAHASEKD
ncbi:unnamed protein product [Cyprideis torosa]|uniref:CTP synthase n=1 Tax=Cyprideis torosa TaxID=163714 RepID=A0A7R8ZR01_9CRUS|nr:unnamed protein product [Cyprideis torosa]CAG0893152.1 unnamed protein product [Cyprideis torosa]